MRKELEHDPDALDALDAVDSVAATSRIHNDSGVDRMTEAQKKRVARFYEVLANSMPLEGRDFRVVFVPMDDGLSVSTELHGLNPLGRAFMAALASEWRIHGSGDYDIDRGGSGKGRAVDR